MKLLYGIATLAFASVASAKTSMPYPTEKVAEFVVEKLDVTTLPSAIRPRHEKTKKTFSDYGFMTRQLNDNAAIIERTPSGSQINIRVLRQGPAGIYVCVEGPGQNASDGHIQRVLLLKLKDPNGLLKNRESGKEFVECPAIGGLYNESQTTGY
jgi:hypothetical protein